MHGKEISVCGILRESMIVENFKLGIGAVSPILDLEQVSLQAMGSYLLQDISLTIESGEIIGLVGASGSGKTSLLRLLNGLASPSSGIVSLDRQPLESYPPTELRRRLLLVLVGGLILRMLHWYYQP